MISITSFLIFNGDVVHDNEVYTNMEEFVEIFNSYTEIWITLSK